MDAGPMKENGRTTGSDLTPPAVFVDAPGEQFAILERKYRGREPGRIPLPRSSHELWAQHKFSVLARD